MTTITNTAAKAVLFTTAHAVAKRWIAADVIFDSYQQAFTYALKKVRAWAKGEALSFPWEPKKQQVDVTESFLEAKASEGVLVEVTAEDALDCSEALKQVYQALGTWKTRDLTVDLMSADLTGWPILEEIRGQILSASLIVHLRWRTVSKLFIARP